MWSLPQTGIHLGSNSITILISEKHLDVFAPLMEKYCIVQKKKKSSTSLVFTNQKKKITVVIVTVKTEVSHGITG